MGGRQSHALLLHIRAFCMNGRYEMIPLNGQLAPEFRYFELFPSEAKWRSVHLCSASALHVHADVSQSTSHSNLHRGTRSFGRASDGSFLSLRFDKSARSGHHLCARTSNPHFTSSSNRQIRGRKLLRLSHPCLKVTDRSITWTTGSRTGLQGSVPLHTRQSSISLEGLGVLNTTLETQSKGLPKERVVTSSSQLDNTRSQDIYRLLLWLAHRFPALYIISRYTYCSNITIYLHRAQLA